MDAETREQLRWKFYRVTLHLNAVILCVALTVIAGFLAPDPYRIPAVLFLVVLDIVLSYTCYRNYHVTKTWLDEHCAISEKNDSEQG